MRAPFLAPALALAVLVAPAGIAELVRGTDEAGRVVLRSPREKPRPAIVLPEFPPDEPVPEGGLSIQRIGDVPFQDVIHEAAGKYGLAPDLIEAVMAVESGFNPYAVSGKGAIGLMQLIPETADRFQVGDIFDPRENVFGGARYLAYLKSLFGGETALVLAAYNAGEKAVLNARGIPPIPETRQYVRKVMAYLGQAPPPALRPRAEPNPDHAIATPQVTGKTTIYRYVDSNGTLHFTNRPPAGVKGVTVWKPAPR